ncbi:hypothetical protein DV451_001589 [Geotrichum candidum]|uniref:60S ribosomal protein L12 n=1 Tax=Geotrichum candidum TaxID=1173061 RepID=A0A9P5KVI2_GEOCN|nr:hypothetical protein DV451_001589 [Geotrichum candidum]KAF5106230.1 hypothetical protein DV453_004133 [Geotrichum candidum]
MPPKFDPSEVKIIYLRATGGEVGASAALAPKIGPLGLSPKKVGEDIAKATKNYKGIRVTVQLTIQNRQATVSVVPSASSLVIGALKEPPRDRKKEKNIKHNGSIPLDEIINIAREMRSKSFAKSLEGTVKEILGTAQSVGARINGKPAHLTIDAINNGEVDSKSRRRGDIATISGSSIYGLGGGAGGGGSGSLGTRSVGGASSISGGANRRMKFVQQQDPEEKWRRDVTWALETINEEILAMRHRYDAVVTGAPPAGPSPGASVPPEMLAQAGSSVHSYRITPHSTILGPPPSQGAAASVYSYSGRHHIKPNIDLPLQHHASQVISGKGSHGGSARDDDDDSFPNKIKLLVQIIQQICRKRIFRLLLNISTRIFVDLAVLRGLLFIYQFLATKKRGRVDGIMGSLIEKLFSVEIKYL